MQAALDMLGPDEFARAYGNRWVSMVARVIPYRHGGRRVTKRRRCPRRATWPLAFDVALDRSDASLVAAWRDETARRTLRWPTTGRASGGCPNGCAELADKWRPRAIGYDMAGPAIDVADVCERAGLER